MTGIEYEQWCAARLRKKGFRNVRMTKASGDQGIDLIAGRNGLTYGFQCKYYSSPIGNDAVQEAYAGKTYYGLDKAAVITNQTFTASAAALAEQTGVELYELETPVSDDHGDLILRIPALILFLSSLYCFAEAVMNAESQGAEYSFLRAGFFRMHAPFCKAHGGIDPFFSDGCHIPDQHMLLYAGTAAFQSRLSSVSASDADQDHSYEKAEGNPGLYRRKR